MDDDIIAQVQDIKETADDETRKRLIDTLWDLFISLEEAGDTLQWLVYLLSLAGSDGWFGVLAYLR